MVMGQLIMSWAQLGRVEKNEPMQTSDSNLNGLLIVNGQFVLIMFFGTSSFVFAYLSIFSVHICAL